MSRTTCHLVLRVYATYLAFIKVLFAKWYGDNYVRENWTLWIKYSTSAEWDWWLIRWKMGKGKPPLSISTPDFQKMDKVAVAKSGKKYKNLPPLPCHFSPLCPFQPWFLRMDKVAAGKKRVALHTDLASSVVYWNKLQEKGARSISCTIYMYFVP